MGETGYGYLEICGAIERLEQRETGEALPPSEWARLKELRSMRDTIVADFRQDSLYLALQDIGFRVQT